MSERCDGRPGKGGHHPSEPTSRSNSTSSTTSGEPTRLPWLKVYVTDALAATQGWSNAAVGACARLFAVQWMQGYLPADPAELCRLVGSSRREWDAIWRQIIGKFPRVGTSRRNPALERERRDAQDRHARQRAASKFANDVRWSTRPNERGEGADHA